MEVTGVWCSVGYVRGEGGVVEVGVWVGGGGRGVGRGRR